ncbi:hypothetical protein AGMMS49992_29960 [Clostridia bacterium]|nr:hypothetical protein AGMMS49992_29960 [Clostridia bacterium]
MPELMDELTSYASVIDASRLAVLVTVAKALAEEYTTREKAREHWDEYFASHSPDGKRMVIETPEQLDEVFDIINKGLK